MGRLGVTSTVCRSLLSLICLLGSENHWTVERSEDLTLSGQSDAYYRDALFIFR